MGGEAARRRRGEGARRRAGGGGGGAVLLSASADLDALVAAALEAVDPEPLVRRALEERPPANDEHVVLVAAGKAALPMARGAVAAVGSRIRSGVVLAPESGPAGGPGEEGRGASEARAIPLPGVLELHRGGHPLPTAAGVDGARAILDAVESAGVGAHVLFLLSGGGSALLTLPPDGVTLESVRRVTRLLMEAGADIGELNTVRKHLDRLKGGGLARAVAPAFLTGLVISDVVGDHVDVIASGPVSPDPTSYEDALRVLERHGPRPRSRRGAGGRGATDRSVPDDVIEHLRAGVRGERPESLDPGDPAFDAVTVRVLANVETALRGAARAAAELGYETRIGRSDRTGEARVVGAELGVRAGELLREAAARGRPLCFLSGGETTVAVTGPGKGGRNQEVALSAALALEEHRRAKAGSLVVASFGTDGIDGPTDVAGAWSHPGTAALGRAAGHPAEAALERNDSFAFFDAVGGHIRTGPTGTNVMDVHVILVHPP